MAGARGFMWDACERMQIAQRAIDSELPLWTRGSGVFWPLPSGRSHPFRSHSTTPL
uniref:Uncharacterized protein n=1 Tax=Magnetococcus massalia (strain MO-1) TaxID=451514 RepID=A0A1S7LHV3_MAGMO|nr:Protein of unknown function [Candidatus Magnetococcus massalia]